MILSDHHSKGLIEENTMHYILKWKCQGVMQIIACRKATGVQGHAPPPRKFFRIVQFGAFWCIFGSDFVFKKFLEITIFYIKKIKNSCRNTY